MIKGISYRGQVFSYPVFDFVYPELLKLTWRRNIGADLEGNLVLNDETSLELSNSLESVLSALLKEFYEKHEETELASYPNRYEHVDFRNNRYVLDITTNPKDRIAFEIFSLLKWLHSFTPHKPS